METVNKAEKIWSDVRKAVFFSKYFDIFRYLSLTICGFAVGSIYNAVTGYDFSDRAILKAEQFLVSPFSKTGNNNAFSVISGIVSAGSADGICLLLIALAGLSVICDLLICVTLMSRGLNLAILTGIFAENSAAFAGITSHPSAASAVVLLFYTLNTVALIVFSAITLRGTAPFRQTLKKEVDVVFSRRFVSMCFTVLCFYGFQVITNLICGMILELIS